MSLMKCKLEQQCDTTTHLLGWLKSRTLMLWSVYLCSPKIYVLKSQTSKVLFIYLFVYLDRYRYRYRYRWYRYRYFSKVWVGGSFGEMIKSYCGALINGLHTLTKEIPSISLAPTTMWGNSNKLLAMNQEASPHLNMLVTWSLTS